MRRDGWMGTMRWPAAMAWGLAALWMAACGDGTEAPGAAGAESTGKEDGSPGAPVVEIETTLGRFKVQLDAEAAPITTANFLRYVEDGYYEGTIFNHIVPGMMMVGGSYTTKMQRKTEGLRGPIPSEWSADRPNVPGSIGMYREPGNPDSADSEFYINLGTNRRLDEPRDGAGYTVFGRVVEGQEAIDRIAGTQLQPHPGNPGGPATVPIVPVMIVTTELEGGFDLAALEAANEARLRDFKAQQETFLAQQEDEVRQIIDQTKAEFGVDFTTTASGLRYATLRAGNGPTPPGPTASVKVHYVGTLTNGKKFDSSYDRNSPATFPLNRVIPGWTEGVGSMKVGEKRRLIIPSDLGYGDRGAPPDIPGKATLVFDVELLEIL